MTWLVLEDWPGADGETANSALWRTPLGGFFLVLLLPDVVLLLSTFDVDFFIDPFKPRDMLETCMRENRQRYGQL